MNFLKILGLEESAKKNYGTLFSRLEEILSAYEDDEKQFFTGFAGLLGSIAYSDREFSDQECAEIEEILKNQTSLPNHKVAVTVDIVRSLTEDLVGIEDYRYTRMINAAADKQKKLEIIACLYKVASADNSISNEEDHRIKIIAQDLMLPPSDFTQVRDKFLGYL
jgi:uncharacterized tellurite resistance protein B-like protein